jgi:hypothetical protein
LRTLKSICDGVKWMKIGAWVFNSFFYFKPSLIFHLFLCNSVHYMGYFW